MIETNKFVSKGLWKAYEVYLPKADEMKYKKDVERNFGVQGGCMPSEIA